MASEREFRSCWQSEHRIGATGVDRHRFQLPCGRTLAAQVAALRTTHLPGVHFLKNLIHQMFELLNLMRQVLQTMWNQDLLLRVGNRSYP